MSVTIIDCAPDIRARLAESPVWSPAERALYWITIGLAEEPPAIHRLDPATGATKSFVQPEPVGAITLADDGRMLVARRSGVFLLNLATSAQEQVIPAPFDDNICEFNDGRCDRQGRFWVGTRSPANKPPPGEGHGKLWSLTRGKLVEHAVGPITSHNGTAISQDGRTLFTSETVPAQIYAYDLNPDTGAIGPRRIHATLAQGWADGATIDAEGCYWSANVCASRLVRIRPDGSVDREIMLPVTFPTMVTFGGETLDELYITSGFRRMTEEERRAEPLAGAILRVQPGVRGIPEPLYRV